MYVQMRADGEVFDLALTLMCLIVSAACAFQALEVRSRLFSEIFIGQKDASDESGLFNAFWFIFVTMG
jgi:hypothetical protein